MIVYNGGMRKKIEESQREWNEWSAVNPPVPRQHESISNLIVAVIVIPMVIFLVGGMIEKKQRRMLLVGILLFIIFWYCLLFPSDILI